MVTGVMPRGRTGLRGCRSRARLTSTTFRRIAARSTGGLVIVNMERCQEVGRGANR